MTVRRNFYPLGMYRFLLDLATDQKLAVDEVAFNILRIGLSELGYTCDHTNVAYSKNDQQAHSKPYCKNCYSRLEQFAEKVLFKGKMITQDEFKPIETFIDRERNELAQKAKTENDARIKAGIDAGVKQFVENLMKEYEQKRDVPTV